MSYEKNTWNKGDVITSAKLNHMEDGIATGGGGAVVVHVTEEDDVYTLDKTWNELQELLASGALVATVAETDDGSTTMQFLTQTYFDNGTYAVAFIWAAITPEWAGQTVVSVYSCKSADGYPYFED